MKDLDIAFEACLLLSLIGSAISLSVLNNRVKELEAAQSTIAIRLPLPPPPPQKLEKQFFDVYLTSPKPSTEI